MLTCVLLFGFNAVASTLISGLGVNKCCDPKDMTRVIRESTHFESRVDSGVEFKSGIAFLTATNFTWNRTKIKAVF